MPYFTTLSRNFLDRPAWNALTGRQKDVACGDSRALRFGPEYGPFAAAANDSPASLSALEQLAGTNEIWFLERSPQIVPPGLVVVSQAQYLQMVAPTVVLQTSEYAFCDLDDTDAAEMQALTSLTVPGPFSEKTHRLGRFIGIKENGRLVAMAGERMKPGSFTELSAVCTHPQHRNLGYARFLMQTVASRILERGEIPFLHCHAGNSGAITLYKTLGFETHQTLTGTVMSAQ